MTESPGKYNSYRPKVQNKWKISEFLFSYDLINLHLDYFDYVMKESECQENNEDRVYSAQTQEEYKYQQYYKRC